MAQSLQVHRAAYSYILYRNLCGNERNESAFSVHEAILPKEDQDGGKACLDFDIVWLKGLVRHQAHNVLSRPEVRGREVERDRPCL